MLKDEVARAIAEAALDAFSRRGFLAATMAEIARAAGVSTGNLYRYYPGKSDLLDVVVPPALPQQLTELLERRMRSYPVAGKTPNELPHLPHSWASEELTHFVLQHRRECVFLLARAEGSRHERFAQDCVTHLVKTAYAQFRALRPERVFTQAERLVVTRIYENLVTTTADLLTAAGSEQSLRERLEAYSCFHLGGLERLLAR